MHGSHSLSVAVLLIFVTQVFLLSCTAVPHIFYGNIIYFPHWRISFVMQSRLSSYVSVIQIWNKSHAMQFFYYTEYKKTYPERRVCVSERAGGRLTTWLTDSAPSLTGGLDKDWLTGEWWGGGAAAAAAVMMGVNSWYRYLAGVEPLRYSHSLLERVATSSPHPHASSIYDHRITLLRWEKVYYVTRNVWLLLNTGRVSDDILCDLFYCLFSLAFTPTLPSVTASRLCSGRKW